MKSRRRSYLVELDISLWVIEREKLVVEADSDSNIQSTKAMKFVREWIFRYLSFWESFLNKNGKWLQCERKRERERERENENVRLYLSIFFFFLWEYTSLSISRDEIILDIYFKGWVRVALKKGRYLKPAHAGEQKLPAFI